MYSSGRRATLLSFVLRQVDFQVDFAKSVCDLPTVTQVGDPAHKDAIGQVVDQISVLLANVRRLNSEFDELGDGIQWLELFQPFISVKELTVEEDLSSSCIPLALNSIAVRRVGKYRPQELLAGI
ncbi:hypothetical protein EDB85DRAFT_2152517 [Lactarius pseudohatsudake]|nr:hypothetical protein EDB85DRAFT_2152517 [Lactarius pseudohatsudake]